ncbi:MAG: c-type cytochrome biogenesis protein CcmI [Pyrinomonadaceae bacterium]
MIIFWVTCIVLVVIALAFVLPPLLQPDKNAQQEDSGRQAANVAVYRDQIAELRREMENGIVSPEQYQEDRDALERRLLQDVADPDEAGTEKGKTAGASRPFAYAFAIGLPVIAVALYLVVGKLDAMSASPSPTEPAQTAAPVSPMVNGQPSQEQIEANVATLAKRLEQKPGDLQGWMMLARSYSSMEKYNEAAGAYAKATALKTDDADLWADYAFAAAMANGRRLEGQPSDLINKALKVDPENLKALQLAGTAAFEVKNYQLAIQYWERLSRKTPPDSEVGQALSRRIDEARALSRAGK